MHLQRTQFEFLFLILHFAVHSTQQWSWVAFWQLSHLAIAAWATAKTRKKKSFIDLLQACNNYQNGKAGLKHWSYSVPKLARTTLPG